MGRGRERGSTARLCSTSKTAALKMMLMPLMFAYLAWVTACICIFTNSLCYFFLRFPLCILVFLLSFCLFLFCHYARLPSYIVKGILSKCVHAAWVTCTSTYGFTCYISFMFSSTYVSLHCFPFSGISC